MSSFNELTIGVSAIIILVGWYFLGKMNNIIGLIFRVIWNFWFKLFSFIPFLGWMSHFIITMNEEDKESKKRFREHASDVRNDVAQQMQESAQRKIAESAAREAEWQEQQRRKLEEDQEWVKKQAWQREGRTDVQFSKDGTRWKYADEDWRDAKNV